MMRLLMKKKRIIKKKIRQRVRQIWRSLILSKGYLKHDELARNKILQVEALSSCKTWPTISPISMG